MTCSASDWLWDPTQCIEALSDTQHLVIRPKKEIVATDKLTTVRLTKTVTFLEPNKREGFLSFWCVCIKLYSRCSHVPMKENVIFFQFFQYESNS